MFTFLYGNLAHNKQEVNGAAARSMRRLCSKCRDQLGEPILSLYDQVMAFEPGHLLRKDELALLDGLSAVVNRLSPEIMPTAIDKMLAPIQVKTIKDTVLSIVCFVITSAYFIYCVFKSFFFLGNKI